MQGSFWTAFGVRFGSGNANNGLDEILEREKFELEDLLDHDDVIQECKYMNAQLIEYLATKPCIEKLVRYVITLPGDEKKEEEKISSTDKTDTNTTHPNPNPPITDTSESPPTNGNSSSSSSSSSPPSSSSSSSSPPLSASSSSSHSNDTPTALTTLNENTTTTQDKEQQEKEAADDKSHQEDESTSSSSISSLSDLNSSEDSNSSIEQKEEESNGESSSTHDHSRYPYISSELFACEVVSMLDVLFDNPDLLDLLFSFLDHPPPMDPSHASYFRKVMVVLIQRKYEPLVKYIRSHNIIDRLVNHIGLYSIMEILIMIGWDDGLGQVNDVEWLYKENLIPKLVAKLTPEYESHTDVHMNAARALVDVVVKCPPTQQNLLISHLQSTPVLQTIFTHMFSGSLSSLTNSMSIIIVLVQRYANKRADGNEEKSSNGSGNITTLPILESSNDDLREEPFSSLSPHLHKIIALLHQPQPEVKVQFGKSQPFGETRMKVVELTLVLLRSRLPYVDAQLAELHVLKYMLESFFLYPWNNMLHGLVESIVRTVLDSESEVLRKALFVDGELVGRFVAAYDHSEEISALGDKNYRLGYMGHLLRTAMAIEEIARKDEETRNLMFASDSERWTAFVNDKLAKENEKQKMVEPTGGEEDILDSLQYDMANMSTDGASFVGISPGPAGVKDDESFSFGDDEEHHAQMGYDYSGNHDEEAGDDWTSAAAGGNNSSSSDSFASNDQWGSFDTQFVDDDASKKVPFPSRGQVHSARTLIEFDVQHEDDDEDEDILVQTNGDVHNIANSMAAAAAERKNGEGATFDDEDFEADFSAAPPPPPSSTTPPSIETTKIPPPPTTVPACEEDFDADFPPP